MDRMNGKVAIVTGAGSTPGGSGQELDRRSPPSSLERVPQS